MGFERRFLKQIAPLILLSALAISCKTAGGHRRGADKVAYKAIEEGQEEALGRTEPFTIDRPQDTLRRRLLLDQNLPTSSPASLGTKELEPIKHWPDDAYLESGDTAPGAGETSDTIVLNLIDALRIGALNSRDYQSRKEQVYLAALDLDLERDFFRPVFGFSNDTTVSSDWNGDVEPTWGVVNTSIFSVTQRLKNGATITSRLGLDLVKMLSHDEDKTRGLFGDATVTIPLMRGAGKHIVTEPLLQAERNVIYAIHDFERFKGTFAVQVASSYLQVLRQLDEVKNSEENYKSLVIAGRRARRLADAGRLPEIQVDQAQQDELRARDRWISAQQAYEARLDSFKTLLGLPTDAIIALDREEFERLADETAAQLNITGHIPAVTPEEALDAEAPVVLVPPSRADAGPLEIEEGRAILIALERRLDLRNEVGRVYDSQRDVVVAADLLRADVTLGGSGSVGSRRSLASAGLESADIQFDEASYRAFLNIDLPLERTRERNIYRQSLIALEREVRALQQLEDTIKSDVRQSLRTLLQSRESLRIQAQSVRLAERRVASTDLFLQAGRAQIRDLLEAQEALISAQNALTAAIVNYRIAELELQTDLGVLEVDETGLWKEPNFEELQDAAG